jgi:hypothetical protein
MIYAIRVYWNKYDPGNHSVFKTTFDSVMNEIIQKTHRWGLQFETWITYDDTL